MRAHHEKVVCEDGFTVSIQASKGNYCDPRIDDADLYTEVELGYPSQTDWLIIEYAEDKDIPTETIYGWVPVHTVYLLLTKHGGVVSGEVPKGVPVYSLSHPRKK
tara:strand:- start:1534 stop:1848 length:315 start_codon:yes stop_codon:yes gene_type:complete